jgi:hypothetical protein
MKDVGASYVHLVYFTVIWYVLLPFGIVYGNLVNIFPVLVCCTTENLATLSAGKKILWSHSCDI